MSSKPVVLAMTPYLVDFMGDAAALVDVRPGWGTPSPADLAVAVAIVVAGEFVLDKAMLSGMPALRMIACFNAGYDGVDVDWAHKRGLVVTYAPSPNFEDAADYAIGLMTAAWRQIVAGDAKVRSGAWSAGSRAPTRSLTGRRVGVVGLGHLGQAVARRAQAMRMPVAWWGPRPKDCDLPRAESLIELARDSDILVVCAKASEDNRTMISREVIEAVGPDGLLVNVARGQLVDEDALIAALKDGRLGGAALDVYAEEPTPAARWTSVPNTVLTPHGAGVTDAALAEMARLLEANLRAVLIEDKPPVTPVP